MNPHDRRVKEAPLPVPMEGLHDQGLPPFLNKTYEFVDDPETNHVVSWTSGNNSFVVWDPQAFALSLLPKYFKHRNFSSFIRQLNSYGFRKVDTDRWEFAHEGFLKGQKHLLKNIRRRNATDHLPHASQRALESCIEVGKFGSLDFKVDQLRRDKDALMEELVRLKQEQHTTTVQALGMEDRLKRTEMKQQQMTNFLARAMRNPNFLQQLVQQKDRKKQLEEAITKKRRRSIEGPRSVEVGGINQVGGETSVKVEPEHFGDISELEVPELDKFAIDMQEISGAQSFHGGEECVENKEEHEARGKDMGESFWKQLLNDVVDEDIQVLDCQEEDEEDLSVLIEQLDSLVPTPQA